MTDVIADLLTRIRNACTSKHETVEIPVSKTKIAIAQILFNEGYIKRYSLKRSPNQGSIKIVLKYDGQNNKPVITGLKRISKPGLRVYSEAKSIPRVMKGLGIAIVSTSKGVMTDRRARRENLGGEILAFIW